MEIFGPVLALKRYAHVQKAIDYIAHHPSPLAA